MNWGQFKDPVSHLCVAEALLLDLQSLLSDLLPLGNDSSFHVVLKTNYRLIFEATTEYFVTELN